MFILHPVNTWRLRLSMKFSEDDLERLAVVLYAAQQDLEEDLSEIKNTRIGTVAIEVELDHITGLLQRLQKQIMHKRDHKKGA